MVVRGIRQDGSQRLVQCCVHREGFHHPRQHRRTLSFHDGMASRIRQPLPKNPCMPFIKELSHRAGITVPRYEQGQSDSIAMPPPPRTARAGCKAQRDPPAESDAHRKQRSKNNGGLRPNAGPKARGACDQIAGTTLRCRSRPGATRNCRGENL